MMRTTLAVCVTAMLAACGGGNGTSGTNQVAPTVITADGQRVNSCSLDPRCSGPTAVPPPVASPSASTPPSAPPAPAPVSVPVQAAVEAAPQPLPPQPTVTSPPPNPIATNRATTDRPDDGLGAMVHIIYAVPQGNVDRGYDLTDRFHNSLHSVNNWFKQKSNNQLQVRFDTYNGEIDITYAALPRTEAEYNIPDGLKLIEDDLRQANQFKMNKIYLIYYDGVSSYTCGGAGALQNGYQSAVMYMRGFEGSPNVNPCSNNPIAQTRNDQPTYLDYVALHELIHIVGVDHVYDSDLDLMYGGGTRWDRPQDIYLDFNLDSYYSRLLNNPYFNMDANRRAQIVRR